MPIEPLGGVTSPLDFIRGEKRTTAISMLESYFGVRDKTMSYEGVLFESLIDVDHPYEITARDIVAVGALGVSIPVRTSAWILGEGREELSAYLVGIGPLETTIWGEGDLSRSGDAWKMWAALRSHDDMGPTKTSKLMAAKRPHLIPIQDKQVREAIAAPKDGYWETWSQAMSEPGVIEEVGQLAVDAQVPENVSLLRVLDIVIWMSVHGYRWLPQQGR